MFWFNTVNVDKYEYNKLVKNEERYIALYYEIRSNNVTLERNIEATASAIEATAIEHKKQLDALNEKLELQREVCIAYRKELAKLKVKLGEAS